MELTESPLLRSLPPEHRTHVPQAVLLVVQQSVLECCANRAGRSLGPKRQAFISSIGKRKHLLFHDVRLVAN